MAKSRVCSINGCDKPVIARALCSKHYQRLRKRGDPLFEKVRKICSVAGCDKLAGSRGWCSKHYRRWYIHGDPLYTPPKRTCSVHGCNKRHYGRGFCQSHHHRWWVHGDPISGRTPEGDPGRFFHEVVLGHEGDDCLIWPFCRNDAGYGLLSTNGKSTRVSRLVCENEHGPPPTDKHSAAHSCGNGHLGCVNRKHLRWATPRENTADSIIHGTICRGERNGCSKLTEEEVKQIRQLKGKMTQQGIADQFGIGIATVNHIIKRKSWSWLRDD